MADRQFRNPFSSLRKTLLGLGLALALAAVDHALVPSTASAQDRAAPGDGSLGLADLGEAITVLADLGDFYATLAANDPNRHAALAWKQSETAYRSAAVELAGLLTRGRISIADLPGTSTSRSGTDRIIVDSTLGGRWQAALVRNTRRVSADEWPFISDLSTALLQAYLERNSETLSNWVAEQRRRSTLDLSSLPAGAGNPNLALARFWHIKDKYFWISMTAMAEAGSEAGRAGEARTAHLQAELLATARDLEAAFGKAFAADLRREWQDYERSVAGFAQTRAWLAARPGATPNYASARPFAAAVALAKSGKEAIWTDPKPQAAAERSSTAPRGEPTAQLAALARGAELESRVAALEAELDGRRKDIARLRNELAAERAETPRRDELVTELAAVRTEAVRLERRTARLEADLSEALASKDRLAVEIETDRTEVALLQQGLSARDEELGRLRETLAEERRAFETKLGDLGETFDSELLASRQTTEALRQEVERERQAGEAAMETLEASLTEDLEASRQTVAALRTDLENVRTERRTKRESAAQREMALLAQLDESRQAAAETEERLTAMLEVGHQELARLTEQLVAQAQSKAPLPPAALMAGVAAMALALLVLSGMVVVMRRQIVQLRGAASGAGFPTAMPWPGRAAPGPPQGQAANRADTKRPHDEARATPAQPPVSSQSLVEALRQGKTEVFEQRLAAMAELREDQVRDMAREPGGERLAILCRGIGIDKLGVASIFLLSRKALTEGEEVEPRDLSKAMAAYDGTTAERAGEMLSAWRAEAGRPAMVERLMTLDAAEENDDQPSGDDTEPRGSETN